jgi:hypothetical protein
MAGQRQGVRSRCVTPESRNRADGVRRVVEVDPQRDSRWEAFVAAHPDGLIYHHPDWLRVIERAYGHQPVGLACEDAGGQLRGVLPLFRTRGLLTGCRLSSLPHTPVAGPLAHDDQATAALVRAAIERVRREPRARLQLKAAQVGLDTLVEELAGWPWELTYLLQLPAQPQELRFGNSRNHARIKWAINKAAKLGVVVRPAQTERELQAWYELYLDTMRWHAVPPRPYGFFKIAWDLLRPPGRLRLLLAERPAGRRRTLLAGSIFLMFGQTVFYAFNGRCRAELSHRPNDIIQWRAIQDACQDGFRFYDFGEVEDTNQGLAEYKTKWGAEPRRLYRYYYPAPHELATGIFKSNGRARRLASAAWRRLPHRATALLGHWIYRHL